MCKTCAKRVKKCVKSFSLTQFRYQRYQQGKQKAGVHTTPEKKVIDLIMIHNQMKKVTKIHFNIILT